MGSIALSRDGLNLIRFEALHRVLVNGFEAAVLWLGFTLVIVNALLRLRVSANCTAQLHNDNSPG